MKTQRSNLPAGAGMLLTLILLLCCRRLIRTHVGVLTDRTRLRRKTVRRRNRTRRVIHNGLWPPAGDSIPPDVLLRHGHPLRDVQQQESAAVGDPLHRLRLEAQRCVEVRRAGPLVAAGARHGEDISVAEVQPAALGPVVCSGVVALVADGEGPGAGRLADQ
ncbi:MAG: hypothetical protein Q9175_003528, partial [Cornicularia normoerica]